MDNVLAALGDATRLAIVARIEKSGGKPSALLAGIVESAPFQKPRGLTKATAAPGENTKEKL